MVCEPRLRTGVLVSPEGRGNLCGPNKLSRNNNWPKCSVWMTWPDKKRRSDNPSCLIPASGEVYALECSPFSKLPLSYRQPNGLRSDRSFPIEGRTDHLRPNLVTPGSICPESDLVKRACVHVGVRINTRLCTQAQTRANQHDGLHIYTALCK